MPVKGQRLFTSQKRAEFLEELRSVGPGDECIRWPGTTGSDYGRVWVDGKKIPASRWVFTQISGPLSDALNVCHTCDSPPCVRPSHLFSGTDKDNLHDAAIKGRMASGERHGRAWLSDDDIVIIRSLRAAGVKCKPIAETFGISEGYVSYLFLHQTRQVRPY